MVTRRMLRSVRIQRLLAIVVALLLTAAVLAVALHSSRTDFSF